MIKKIIIIIIILMLFQMPVLADDSLSIDEISEDILESFNFYDSFYMTDNNNLYTLTGYNDIKELFYSMINGEFDLSLQDVFNNIISTFKNNFSEYIHIIISVTILSIIYSLIDNAGGSYLNEHIAKITFCSVYISIISILVNYAFDSVTDSIAIINNLITFINQFTPAFFLLLTTSGGIITSSVIYPIMLFYTSMINAIICNYIIPIATGGFVLSLCSKIISTIDFSYLINFIKKFTYFIIGGSFTLFGIIVSFEGIVFSSVDSVSTGAFKYTVSSLVPIIGKFIADSTDVIHGFLGIIRNSLGFMGVIIIFSIMIFPTLKILSVYLSVRLCSIIIQPFANKKISEAVNDTAHQLFFISVCIIFVTLMLIVIMGVLLIFANNIYKLR